MRKAGRMMLYPFFAPHLIINTIFWHLVLVTSGIASYQPLATPLVTSQFHSHV